MSNEQEQYTCSMTEENNTNEHPDTPQNTPQNISVTPPQMPINPPPSIQKSGMTTPPPPPPEIVTAVQETKIDKKIETYDKKKPSTFKSVVKEIIIFAIIALGIVLPFRIYIAEPYVVSGASMDPTFATGDYLIVDKLSYELGSPERNSVVIFRYPNDPTKNFIKRIIGLPGETVIQKGNEIMIKNSENPNGFVIDQSYIKYFAPSDFEKTLSGDEYFVMGDNRAESFDSRSWGPLPKKFILGKPILRLFPVSEIGISPGADTK